jgi:hypothetical protein
MEPTNTQGGSQPGRPQEPRREGEHDQAKKSGQQSQSGSSWDKNNPGSRTGSSSDTDDEIGSSNKHADRRPDQHSSLGNPDKERQAGQSQTNRPGRSGEQPSKR